LQLHLLTAGRFSILVGGVIGEQQQTHIVDGTTPLVAQFGGVPDSGSTSVAIGATIEIDAVDGIGVWEMHTTRLLHDDGQRASVTVPYWQSGIIVAKLSSPKLKLLCS
jgi:hypothetical protein